MSELLAQCDLKGADSWTIACNCAAEGDPTMLDDLRAGMKIQNNVAVIYDKGIEANAYDRPKLKALGALVDPEGWLYHGSKAVVYGSSYGMAEDKMAQGLLTTSYKNGGTPIFVEPRICKDIQDKAFFVRYPGILAWRKRWERELVFGKGQLVSSVGHIRTFHGRKVDWKGGVRVVNQATLREALASEPQLVTTWCIKKAQERCYYDPENCEDDGSLRVKPCLTVHDSLIMRLRAEYKDFAKTKIPVWFSNPVTIAGITVTIPYSGTLGASWDMKESEPV